MDVAKLFYVAGSILLGVGYNLWRVITSAFQITDLLIVVGLVCFFFLYFRALKIFFWRDSFILPLMNNYDPEDSDFIQM